MEAVPFEEVTVTDWLRLIVRQQGLTNDYQVFPDNALSSITLRPAESWASAAARVLVAFRATPVDPARPRVTEPAFGVTYQRSIKTFYERAVEVVLPNVVDRVKVSGLLHIQFIAVDETLEPLRI